MSDSHESTAVERAAHAYCPRCHPDPQQGVVVTALCGASHPYWGRRDRPVTRCPACTQLAAAPVFRCGHSG
jgi:hypothetical protein